MYMYPLLLYFPGNRKKLTQGRGGGRRGGNTLRIELTKPPKSKQLVKNAHACLSTVCGTVHIRITTPVGTYVSTRSMNPVEITRHTNLGIFGNVCRNTISDVHLYLLLSL